MKKIFSLLPLVMVCLLVSNGVFAAANSKSSPLNLVTFQLNAEQWVTTQTAKVIVNINAAMGTTGLANVHQDVIQRLELLSQKAAWHVTSFRRSQDSSGLERVIVRAEARLPESALAKLRDSAKRISRPGLKVTIADIQFTPSWKEIQGVRAVLRSKIYGLAKKELAHLNKVYPEQHYQLHKLTFMQGNVLPTQVLTRSFAATGGAKISRPMSVSNKIYMMAAVTLAAKMG